MPKSTPLSLTVVINTKNEEHNLARCLKSLKSLAEQVLVVDMGSTDRTVKIAKEFGAKVLHYEKDYGFADPARNFAFSKVETDWILVLDADEELTPELITFITARVESPTADVYYLPRKNIFFGQWVEHAGWWPDHNPRFFRNGYLSWPGRVHGAPEVKGRTEFLPAKEKLAIIHHNYQSIEHFIEKLNRYTSLSAQGLTLNEIKAPVSSAQALDRFFSEFLRRYLGQEGWKDGVLGSGVSILQATYELTTLLKVWELNGCPTTSADPEGGLRRLQALKGEINYWLADHQVKSTSGLKQLYWRVRRKLKV